MSGGRFELPPGLTGTPEQQLRQLYSYLYRLSGALNVSGGTESGAQDTAALLAAVAAGARDAADSLARVKRAADSAISAANAAISALEGRAQALEERAYAQETLSAALEADVSALEGGLAAAQADVAALEEDAQTLSAALTAEGEDVIVAGSLTVGDTELTEARLRELLGLS